MATAIVEAAALGKKINMTQVLVKVSKNFGWTATQTRYALDWYLRFLYLRKIKPNEPLAALSHAADDLWRQHILDTRKYADDCQTLFGLFLNHQPIYGIPKSRELEIIESTKAVYLAAFGTLPHDMKVTSGDYSYAS